MTRPRSILCGGITLGESDPLRNGRLIVELNAKGPEPNVNIRLMDLAKVFLKHISPRLEDLLEIASYVYSTDCATSRGGEWTDDKSVEPWSRDLQFIVPVRDHAFWAREDVGASSPANPQLPIGRSVQLLFPPDDPGRHTETGIL